MQNISFALTTRQVRESTPDNPLKDITRRIGWASARPGQRLMACVKCQGIKPGQLERIRAIEIVSVRREPLNALLQYKVPVDERTVDYYDENDAFAECRREGFPDLTPHQFVEMFCLHMNCFPQTEVTRIEFKYVGGLWQPEPTTAALAFA